MNDRLYFHFCRAVELAGVITTCKRRIDTLTADLQSAVAAADVLRVSSIAHQIDQEAAEAISLHDNYQRHRNVLIEDETNTFALGWLDRMAKLTP